MQRNCRILTVYIEPTPYVIGLIDRLSRISPDQIEVVFIYENKSQQWNIKSDSHIILSNHGLKRFKQMIEILQTNSYQLIQVAGWRDPIALLCIIWANIKKIPIFLMSDSQLASSSIWKQLIKKIFYPMLFKKVTGFIAAGKRQVEYLQHYGVATELITHAQMTVDVQSITQYIQKLNLQDKQRIRQHHGLNLNNILFLFVGRLEPKKGIINLVNAFVACQFKEASLIIVGDGSLQQFVLNQKKIHHELHYLGRLSGDALFDIYFAADIFILPSEFEPWGLVLNEAMAIGLPIIVTKTVGAVEDLIEHNKTGLVFNVKNLEELKKYMLRLYHLPYQRHLLSSNSKKKIANWTLENRANIIYQKWCEAI